MRNSKVLIVTAAGLLLACIGNANAQLALPTSFTYQGELRQAGEPVAGEADMVYKLFDAETDGSQIGDTVSVASMPIAAGRFAVNLDFGVEVFNGDARWLEIEVEYPSGEGNWTTLSPRQLITAAPYALQTRGIFCDEEGRIGIGTTNPARPLQVRTTSGSAVYSAATAGSGYAAAFEAYVASPNGYGLNSFNEAEEGNAYAMYGETASTEGIAICGYAGNSGQYNSGIGVYGKTVGELNAVGVLGEATAATGTTYGVRGESNHIGVHGEHTASGNYGLLGTADAGVYGKHAYSESYGELGTELAGVYGHHVTDGGGGTGIWGEGGIVGVTGHVTATWGGYFEGVHGGVDGDWPDAIKCGVRGAAAGDGNNYGVYGRAAEGSWSIGVYGIADTDDGEAYAGYFHGDVHITGNLTKGGGAFKIDHPLDPENKYLSHSFVESSEMMNVYSGTVRLDDAGEAWIELPEWFEALNKDFRYQLTCIGAFAPVYIAEEIVDNMFMIAGGEPGLKVSWQVTGVRKDPYAQAHPIEIESDKPENERGLYQHPEAYGLPRERGISYRHEKGPDRKTRD